MSNIKKESKLKPALLCYEDLIFWVDLVNKSVDVIESDGTRRVAKTTEANLFELLKYGRVVGRRLPSSAKAAELYKDIMKRGLND